MTEEELRHKLFLDVTHVIDKIEDMRELREVLFDLCVALLDFTDPENKESRDGEVS